MVEEIAKRDTLSILLSQDAVKHRFETVLGKKAPGFMSSIISATNANPELKKAEPMSIISAAAVAASLDLPINPSLGFAHIVPYKKDGVPIASFQMGWRGFVQLGMRTGQYRTINITQVYEGELVSRNRFTGEMEFKEDAKVSEKIIGYVAYFKLINGFEKYYYMTTAECQAHGKRYSRSYSKDTSKWQTDFDAMSMKTVIKMLLSKFGILSIDMQTAIQADQAVIKETGEYEYIDNVIDIGPGEEQSTSRTESVKQALRKRGAKPEEKEPSEVNKSDNPQIIPPTQAQEDKIRELMVSRGIVTPEGQKAFYAYVMDPYEDAGLAEKFIRNFDNWHDIYAKSGN